MTSHWRGENEKSAKSHYILMQDCEQQTLQAGLKQFFPTWAPQLNALVW